MEGSNGTRTARWWIRSTVLPAVLGLWAGGAVGCKEHRLTLAEFLEMEEAWQSQQKVADPGEAALPVEVIEAINRRLGPYEVGPGDVIKVTFTDAESSSVVPQTDARVNSRGMIDLPVVGSLQVAGQTLDAVEETIHDAYVPKVFDQVVVHVDIVNVDSTEVLVLGAVEDPGLVPLRRTERNLLFAIIGSGGATDAASGVVTLERLRRPGENVTLNLREADQLRAALALDPLDDGDIIRVEAAEPNTIFVGGLVNMPRPQTYPAGVKISVLQALAGSGGLRTDVFPTEGTLIRRMPDGEDVHVLVRVDKVTRAEEPNILLEPGDILWVNHTAETRIQDWINKNIFFRAGITATAGVDYNATAIEFMNSNAKRSTVLGRGDLEDRFDPFGFLLRNSALSSLTR